MCLQPIQLLNYTLEVAKPGRLPAGKTEIPFELPVKAKGNKELYETYHGVFVNIQVKGGGGRCRVPGLLSCAGEEGGNELCCVGCKQNH